MEKTCVIVLSFGMGEWRGDYGASNLELARIASKSEFPIIAQWEVARLMEKNFSKYPLLSIEKNKMKYLNSYDVLLRAKDYMKEVGFTEAILLGHQDHMPRIKLISKKLGIKRSITTIIHKDIPYDEKSTQFWTKNKFIFVLHEFIAWPIMFLKGQI